MGSSTGGNGTGAVGGSAPSPLLAQYQTAARSMQFRIRAAQMALDGEVAGAQAILSEYQMFIKTTTEQSIPSLDALRVRFSDGREVDVSVPDDLRGVRGIASVSPIYGGT